MPLVIELYCGLFGWSEGFVAEGWESIGFDIVDMSKELGKPRPKGCQLVLQDVTTLHGSQFKDADAIVASPPCQRYSFMAMPFKRGKARAKEIRADATGEKLRELNALFDACFRIQREACEAAGWHIPMVVENVRGAQPWVGRSKYNYGAFHLWGDVPALMPSARKSDNKLPAHINESIRQGKSPAWWTNPEEHYFGRKIPGLNLHDHEKTGKPGRSFQSAAVEHQKQPVWFNDDKRRDGNKCGGDWYGSGENCSLMRSMSSKSSARKHASAEIAKIPLPLSRWIARSYAPTWPTGAPRIRRWRGPITTTRELERISSL